MKGKKHHDDPTTDGRFIQSLSGLWRHFHTEGYEPQTMLDLRPWVVVFHSPENSQPESWIICTSSSCPSDIYGLASSVLPDTIILEGFGSVNCIDYMVFQA